AILEIDFLNCLSQWTSKNHLVAIVAQIIGKYSHNRRRKPITRLKRRRIFYHHRILPGNKDSARESEINPPAQFRSRQRFDIGSDIPNFNKLEILSLIHSSRII